jgi:2-polyprenyl-3-methyl-5-hydroxy-6-metoxy-1,4-benzoquinol methylase
MTGSLTPGYFEALYETNPDPWAFETSGYEAAKYEATLAALPEARIGRGLEIGCSIGVLTRKLAARCDALVAVDVAEAALDRARARCADQGWVSFQRLCVPGEWPAGRFDMILLSEVLYYLDDVDLAALSRRVVESLAPGGAVLLVHWLGATDYPAGGDAAADGFIAACGGGMAVTRQERTGEYRLDLLG